MAAGTETMPKDLRIVNRSRTRRKIASHSTVTTRPVSMSFAAQSPKPLGPR